MGELPESQTHVPGLTIGKHSTGQGLPPVFQLKPNERVDAAAGPGLGQKRLQAADHRDLGQQLQKRPQGQGLLLFQLLGLFQQMLKGCSGGESSPDFSFSRLFSMC